MKILKKLSLVSLIFVMCALLGLVVYAGTSVEYSGTLSSEKLCVTGEEQEITLTVKLSSPQNFSSLDATIVLPDGWSIVSITNDELGLTADYYEPSTGKIVWFTDKEELADYENVSLIAVIKVNIPANVTADDYTITVKDIEVTSNYGQDVLEVESTEVSKLVTIAEHDWKAPSYTWGADHATCTATSVCGTDGSHVRTETVETTKEVKTPATCTVKGWHTYTADFTASWAADKQSTNVQNIDIDPDSHSWEEPTYTFSVDGKTCTAKRVCKYNSTHEETEDVNTTGVEKTPATCVAMGVTTYTANFEAAWAVDGQTKDVQDIAINADNHAYPATPSSYTDNGDGTHTANYVCGNDANHIEKKNPVSHTYDQAGDKCVCGAVKPVTTVVKGDIDLDGDVDSDDLTLLARHVGGIEVITDTAVLANANVNGDGGVDSDDLTKHARYVGGIITDWSQE